MNFYLIFSKVSVIFLLIIVGFILSKKKILSSEGQKELTSLLLYVLLPCTLIKSFDIEYSSDILARGLKMSVFMFAIYIVSYLIATLVSKKYAEPENRRDIHVLSMILPNVGFMGYPIVNALIGPEAIIYAVMCNV
ncbi:MAG: AEC family transporter, partial [Proteocatella sp.]|nr:AEC family transporter [Proteocatella sp.]